MATENEKTAVSPTQPPAPWIGGKKLLAPIICPIIDAHSHSTYAEPFVGMGGVFFRRRSRPRAEIVNDRGRDVATFFRILQRHYPQFIETLRFQLTTRTEFERLARTDADTLTDLERAARFLYLQHTAWGGKVTGQNFGVQVDQRGGFDLGRLTPMLEGVHERLSGVTVECLDFADFIRRYDSAGTLFYLDPPYDGSEGYYGKDLFGPEDFLRLADQLATIQGRFILSVNDTAKMRAAFSAFDQKPVTTRYSASREARETDGDAELLISNGVDLSPSQSTLFEGMEE